jgi:hypothetical protein
VMRSVQVLAVNLTPRAQRTPRTAVGRAAVLDLMFVGPSWRSWGAWRDAVSPSSRSESHAKNATKDRFPVASELGSDVLSGAVFATRTSHARCDATVEKWNRREPLGDLRVMRSVQVLAVNLTPRAQRTPRRIGPALLPAATITADDENLSRHRIGGAVVVDHGERDLGAPAGSAGRLVLVLNENAVGRRAVAE